MKIRKIYAANNYDKAFFKSIASEVSKQLEQNRPLKPPSHFSLSYFSNSREFSYTLYGYSKEYNFYISQDDLIAKAEGKGAIAKELYRRIMEYQDTVAKGYDSRESSENVTEDETDYEAWLDLVSEAAYAAIDELKSIYPGISYSQEGNQYDDYSNWFTLPENDEYEGGTVQIDNDMIENLTTKRELKDYFVNAIESELES
jgi:hypothetical protein